MFRRLLTLAMFPLMISVASAYPSPTYRYVVKEGRNQPVCQHMLSVFNSKFARPWYAPPMPWSKTDQNYSANSKYAFPLLSGVKHSTKDTFRMRFLAQPTSPEFSEIHWKEGDALLGGCPAGKTCPGEGPDPILIAHFDFDNDGATDTVIVLGSFPGYPAALDYDQVYLTVWRGQTFTPQGIPDLWKLDHPANATLTPIITSGLYLRPFMYEGHVYIASYRQHYSQLDSDPDAIPDASWTPSREDMLVQQYFFAGDKEKITGRPKWSIRTICDFGMKNLGGK
jgi:hypothetical protein